MMCFHWKLKKSFAIYLVTLLKEEKDYSKNASGHGLWQCESDQAKLN